MTNTPHVRLHRELGLIGAVMMGLGAMVGTGVFVSIGIAARQTGPSVILAVLLAAAVAMCNAFSSAQLAASHAVSGGTYEYGYRYLRPWMGFTAGWMFLCAKSASAAAAALGFAAYALGLSGQSLHGQAAVGAIGVALFTALVLGGMQRSNWVNIAIVSFTLLALGTFIVAGMPTLARQGTGMLTPFFNEAGGSGARDFLYSTALMFVAFTGYGRIATMGEEVRKPHQIIPRAIIVTLIISTLLYVLVAAVVIGVAGTEQFATSMGPYAVKLSGVARLLGAPWIATVVSLGAVTAMLGVLLNLILGLSRVALAMGRRGDLPPVFAKLHGKARVPFAAVVGVGLAIGVLVLTRSVESVWTFSAFTVLIYYAITNFAALQLPSEDRLYPRIYALVGLIASLFLAFWVPTTVWITGLALIAVGLAWHLVVARSWQTKVRERPDN